MLNKCDAAGVCANTLVCCSTLPALGLAADLTFPYRVYVLQCGSSMRYVGYVHKSKLRQRVQSHFDGTGAFFTKEHKPSSVLMVWPAAGPAVEAYVFYALLAGLPANSVHRLGGWTQTSARVAPLPRLLFEQDRRLLNSSCFNCGGSRHVAQECTMPLAGALYKCNRCGEDVTITARGQSTPRPSLAQQQASPKPTLPEAVPAARVGQKRRGDGRAAKPASKRFRPASPRVCRVLKLCGELYSPLSWYLGTKNPSPSLTARATANCSQRAVELDGGHSRALEGFAGDASGELKPVTGDRQRLGSAFVKCEVASVRLRRAPGGIITKRLSQVLFVVSDLQKEFG